MWHQLVFPITFMGLALAGFLPVQPARRPGTLRGLLVLAVLLVVLPGLWLVFGPQGFAHLSGKIYGLFVLLFGVAMLAGWVCRVVLLRIAATDVRRRRTVLAAVIFVLLYGVIAVVLQELPKR
jgi:hypothetical protein